MTRKKDSQAPRRSRVRVHLLVLLWIWAGFVFVIVDLFKNVSAFDSVRPRSSLYRGMRVAAHKMAGTELDASDLQLETRTDHAQVGQRSPVPSFKGGDGIIHGEVVFESGEAATYFEYRMVKGINARGRPATNWTGISGPGNFKIANLQPGAYRMWFRVPGARPVSVAGVRPGPGDDRRAIRVVLPSRTE